MKRIVLFFLLLPLACISCLKEEDHHIDIQYEGDQLRYISCPLGGIGTGDIVLDGYGSIRDFEIFNRASMDEQPPYMTLFSLYAKMDGQKPVSRVMEGEFLSEFPNPFGKPRQQLGGLPRFREAVFHNAYPFARVDLKDEAVPLKVQMEAWSPFIPVDPVNSSLPSAIIEWKITNEQKEGINFSIAFSMGNPMKASGTGSDKREDQLSVMPYGKAGWKGFTFSAPESDLQKPDAGQFRVLFPRESELSMPLYEGRWWDDAHIFWDDFTDDGMLERRNDTAYHTASENRTASMYISGRLEPGETRTIPFLFTWHVPVRKQEDNMAFDNDKVRGAITRNYYTKLFPGIDTISDYLVTNLDMLRKKTLDYSETMITSSVPVEVLDAAISNSASLKTNLLMQNENGHIHGYEGLGNDFGCCAGNCTHVWNYAQTMAALFPSLERNVRETGFKHSTHENGYQCFRTVFPLSDNWFKSVAADGQMGNIMRVYREWKMAGNNEWLGLVWPEVKAALEFAWKGAGEIKRGYEWMNNYAVPWDPHKEGVLRGDQHNTYDINFFGPNMMTGSLYLGALKACSEMAMAMSEPALAEEYKALYRKGRAKYSELLWNGEYFVQKVEVIDGVEIPSRLQSPPDENGKVIPKYQYENGCLSDQLLGQYLAFVSGLGYVMDTAMTKKALSSVFKYNFREQMRDFENVQRIYAANEEPGLVICSWPAGDKPVLPFVYSDEVWTGIEYQVATSLIYAGLMNEGLTVARGVRSRYDGSNRNPFAEIESGRYYARAMASWGVYQAMAGYHYDGPEKRMGFSPAEDVLPIRFFWSTGSGWGSINVSRAKVELKCLHGSLELEDLFLAGKSFFVFREFNISHPAEVSFENEALNIHFPDMLVLKEGETFQMDLP